MARLPTNDAGARPDEMVSSGTDPDHPSFFTVIAVFSSHFLQVSRATHSRLRNAKLWPETTVNENDLPPSRKRDRGGRVGRSPEVYRGLLRSTRAKLRELPPLR